MARKSLEQTLTNLIAQLTPTLREAFLVAIADVTDNVILADLIKAIEAGDYDRAFRSLGMSDAAMRPITQQLATIFETGGIEVGKTFPTILNTPFGRTVFRFDVRTPRAESFLREQSSRMITRIQEDTRVNIRNILTTNLEIGNNPRTSALDIVGRIGVSGKREGGIIGLDQNQELWVRNARLDLQTLNPRYLTRMRRDQRFDSIVRQAIADGKPLPQATIDKLLSRYKDSLLQLRGENIARTETIQSLNSAQFQALRQAVDMGATKPENVKREWDTAGDSRVRHTHEEMDEQQVGLEEAFKTPDGESLMFPGDGSLGASAKEIINCRCRVKMKIDWLADID